MDQYNVTRKLGQAMFGSVWLCQDKKDHLNTVAIKQVNLREAKEALTKASSIDNPAQERRLVRHLMQLGGHANVLHFHQDFVENGAWHLVMEHCEGGDLLGRLQTQVGGSLREMDAMRYFRQVVHGVQFLHEHGIAHRDLSLENVLLRNEVCKISDFGLSADHRRVCVDHVGKAYYMAPEVVAMHAYDPFAADMWSLGIMLFIMLTGSPLVPLAAHDERAFVALQELGLVQILEAWGMTAGISRETTVLLVSLLEVHPRYRPTITEVIAYLEVDDSLN